MNHEMDINEIKWTFKKNKIQNIVCKFGMWL